MQNSDRIHVAVIMDGNGRWAAARGWPRLAGHRAGTGALRRAIEASVDLGVGTLTLYAFSSDNWRRPPEETGGLMRLFEEHLEKETVRCLEQGVRINVIGRRDRLTPALVDAIERAEAATASAERLWLRIAVDYSSRDSILGAAGSLDRSVALTREQFGRALAQANHSQQPAPEVDLLIRTGGEKRLSDFLLWECAYAELFFLPALWPDFQGTDLEACLREFRARNRRFGALPLAAA
jgi:undecaprenyl diphosphate synthase